MWRILFRSKNFPICKTRQTFFDVNCRFGTKVLNITGVHRHGLFWKGNTYWYLALYRILMLFPSDTGTSRKVGEVFGKVVMIHYPPFFKVFSHKTKEAFSPLWENRTPFCFAWTEYFIENDIDLTFKVNKFNLKHSLKWGQTVNKRGVLYVDVGYSQTNCTQSGVDTRSIRGTRVNG